MAIGSNTSAAIPVSKSVPIAANLACFFAMVSWASAFPASEILLESWGAVALMTVRLALAVVALMLYWWWREGSDEVNRAPWAKAIYVGGLGFGIGTALLLLGQYYSDPVTAALAAAMMPLVGGALEVILDGRKLRSRLLIGLTFALVGGYLATGSRLGEGTFGLGAVLCVTAVVLFGWATRAATRYLPGTSSLGQSATTLVGALFFAPAIWLIAWGIGLDALSIGKVDALNIFCIVIYAFVSMAFAQTLWMFGAGKLGIFIASFHMNAVPFYVMVSVVLIFGEPWSWMQALGALLVGVGVIISQTGSLARIFHKGGPV